MKKTTKRRDDMSLELDGHIYLVIRKGGHVTREEIDGKVVLRLLEHAISEGIRRLDEDGTR